MRTFDVQAIEIRAPSSQVFDFVRQPRNLPRWAHAFRAADDERARLETPAGAVDIGLRTEACAAAGSVDWRLEFPDGSVALAQSRVVPTARDTSIFTFVLHAPPVPLEEVEGALEAQSQTLRGELAALRSLLEPR